MIERLTSQDRRFTALCFLCISLSVLVVCIRFSATFPVSPVPLTTTPQESREQAELFLKNRQWDISGYRHVSDFNWHPGGSTFLSQQLGVQEGARLYDEIQGWRWRHRWFKPGEPQEFRVEVTTTGRLASFRHVMPESASGETLSQESARDMAEFFLAGRLAWDTGQWTLVKAETNRKDSRTDHEFTWRRKGLEVAGATDRLQIMVHGSEIAGYNRWLEIPQTWWKEQGALQSRRNTINTAWFCLPILAVAVSGIMALRMKGSGLLRWRTPGVLAGMVGLVFLVTVFRQNSYDITTTGSYAGQLATVVVLYLILAIFLVLLLFVCLTGTEVLYRRSYPDHLQLQHILSSDGIKTRTFFKSWLIAITLVCLSFALRAISRLVGAELGVWVPPSVPDYGMLAMKAPWVFMLASALVLAILQEVVSRFFCVTWLRHVTRRAVAVVIVTGVVWGFNPEVGLSHPLLWSHLEAGLIGILAAWAFHRFGFLSTLLWSFWCRLMESTMPLFRAEHPYLVATGVVCMGFAFLPLVYTLVSYRRLGGFLTQEGLQNRSDPLIPNVRGESKPTGVEGSESLGASLPKRTQRIILSGLLASLLVWIGANAWKPRQTVEVSLSRKEAVESAKRFLQEHEIRTDTKVIGVALEREVDLAREDLLQKRGPDALRRLYAGGPEPMLWKVRFFQPGDPHEHRVDIDPRRGNVSGFEFILPDSEGVPSITEEEARGMAEQFLEAREFPGMGLVGSERVERDRRVDHIFLFEGEEVVSGASVRHELTVHGDRIGSYRRTLKVPEAWTREHASMLETVGSLGLIIVCLFCIVMWVICLVQAMRSHPPRWGTMLVLALAVAVLDRVKSLLNFSSALARAPAHDSYREFLMGQATNALLQFLLISTLMLFLLVSVDAFYPQWTRSLQFRWRRAAGDGIHVALATLAWIVLVESLTALDRSWPTSETDVLYVPDLGGTYPFADGFLEILFNSVLVGSLLLVARQLFLTRFRSRKGRFLLLGLILLIAHPGEGGMLGTAKALVEVLLGVGGLAVLVKHVWRDQVRNYFLAGLVIAASMTIPDYFAVSSGYYRLQGMLLLTAVMLLFLVLVRKALGTERTEETSTVARG